MKQAIKNKFTHKAIILCVGMISLFFCPIIYGKSITTQQAIDMQKIHNVIARYVIAWDFMHAKDFNNVFTENATIIDSVIGKVDARYTLKQFIVYRTKGQERKRSKGTQGGHNLSATYFFTITKNSAKTITPYNYFCFPKKITPPKCNIRGSYVDTWRKTSNGWRIQKRIIHHYAVPKEFAKAFEVKK